MATFARGHWARKTKQHNAEMLRAVAKTDALPSARHLSDAIIRDRIVMQLLSRDGDRCYLCNMSSPPSQYQIDHIIARSRGGEDRLHNYALTCRSCNARKSDRIVSIRLIDRIPCYWLAT